MNGRAFVIKRVNIEPAEILFVPGRPNDRRNALCR